MWWLFVVVAIAAAAGEFRSTPKELVFLSKPPAARYSFAHCFSGNEQPKDGWRTTSCLVRNLCFNTTSKEFLFFTNSSRHHLPAFTSQGTFNYKWAHQYDDTVKFQPKAVVGGGIPPAAKFTPAHELWLPYLPLAPTNIGHLVWDDYLAWFLLTKAAQVVVPEISTMRPLWVNPPPGKRAPWATCDWVRLHEGPGHTLPAGYSSRCLKNNQKWLPFILGPEQHQVLETNQWSEDELVCFSNAGLGMTSFANQGSGHHGWNPGDGAPPAFGRAPLLFEFTRHMMKLAGVNTTMKPTKEVVVLFSSKSSDRIKLDFSPAVRELERTRSKLDLLLARQGYKLVVHHQIMYELSPKQQMELSSKTCVYLTAAGGGAFTAQFLPKGSALLLFQDNAAEHLHQGNVDWKVFNSASWLRTQFLHHHVASGNVTRVVELIAREVEKCATFSQ
ncbi:hypothetical protein BASA81_002247 [Batrachochytrium salamandrivorans]|nr:hypothetical protein BASA81_002247 [Batrachochytrium salamandrivorans]